MNLCKIVEVDFNPLISCISDRHTDKWQIIGNFARTAYSYIMYLIIGLINANIRNEDRT